MKRNKIIYFPYNNRTVFSVNKSQNDFMDALRVNYDVIRMESVSIDVEKLKDVKAAVLNWPENSLDDVMKARMGAYRKLGIKVVWFFHNRMPHEDNTSPVMAENIKWMAENSDAIMLLSKSSAGFLPGQGSMDKAVYIPHPIFDVGYTEEFIRHEDIFGNGKLTVGMLGSIRSDKRFEMIIKLAAEGLVNLIIAGRASQPSYAEDLRRCVEDLSNVLFTVEHVSEQDFIRYHRQSDIIALPFDTRSCMNSGSMIMAFSCAKPVLTTDMAMARDLEDKDFVHMVKDTIDEDQLALNLRRGLEECISQGASVLREQGGRARRYVEENNSFEAVAETFRTVIG